MAWPSFPAWGRPRRSPAASGRAIASGQRAPPGNGLLIAAVLGAILAGVGLAFLEPILKVFGASVGLMPYAKEYTRIILYGVFFNIMGMAASNILRAQGKAKPAMFSICIGAFLNVGLDPLFIFVFHMGVAGAAWATIISQLVSFVYVVAYLGSKRVPIAIHRRHFIPHVALDREILGVGSSALIRSISSTIFSIVVNNSLGLYGGDMAITIFGIVNRVIVFLFLPALGIVQGMQPIAGYNYGAKNLSKVRAVLHYALAWATILSVLGWLVAQFAPHILIGAFTSDANVIQAGSRVLRIVFALAPVIGMQLVGSALFQSLGKAVPAIVLSLLRQFIILTPLILILPHLFGLGLEGVWLAFPIADGAAAIIVLIVLARESLRLRSGSKLAAVVQEG